MQTGGGKKDRQLWAALKNGREEALSELFQLHVDGLYNYGYMLCRNKELVEDCLQDLFLDLWKKRKGLSEVKRVRTYLMIALRHRIRDSFRKKGQKIHSLSELPHHNRLPTTASVEEDWVNSERRDQQSQLITQALNILPERMRQAIYLRYFEGFEYSDIAEIMNVRPQVAVNMVYRATKKLRAYSGPYSEWLLFLALFFLI